MRLAGLLTPPRRIDTWMKGLGFGAMAIPVMWRRYELLCQLVRRHGADCQYVTQSDQVIR